MIDIDLIMESAEWNSLRGFGWQKSSVTYDEMYQIITRLRQAEKDAARYRWIKENSKFGVGRCGVDWELCFEGPAPDNSAMIELHIDEAMQCK